MKLKHYLLAALCGVGFVVVLWLLAGVMDGVNLIFLSMLLLLAAMAMLSNKLHSWEAMRFSLTSLLSVFVVAKLFFVVATVINYRQDGFLADYEVGSAQMAELLLSLFTVTTLMMSALVRFVFAKKKLRQTPKRTLKTLGFGLVLLIALGAVNYVSWNATAPLTEKFDRYCAEFTVEKWAEYPYKRELMTPDFLVRYRGKSEDEVKAALGTPEDETLGYFIGSNVKGDLYLLPLYEDGVLTDVQYDSKSPYGEEINEKEGNEK